LNRCKEVASRCEDMKQAANVDDSERKMWATIVAGVRSAADELLVAVDDIDDEDDSQAGRSSIG